MANYDKRTNYCILLNRLRSELGEEQADTNNYPNLSLMLEIDRLLAKGGYIQYTQQELNSIGLNMV